MKLTEHFSLEEFTFSEIAARKGLDNTPSEVVTANLRIVAERMETIREAIQQPIIITSGYRSERVNKLVGGSATSAHCDGWACDFRSPAFGSNYALARRVSGLGLKFDQIIHEYGQWVHVSFDPRTRLQLLTIFSSKIGYKPGILTREEYFA